MKKWARILAIILALGVMLSLAACGSRAADTGVRGVLKADAGAIRKTELRSPEALCKASGQRRTGGLAGGSFGSRLFENIGKDPFYLQTDLTATLDQSALDPVLLSILIDAVGVDFGWLQSLCLSLVTGSHEDLARTNAVLRLNGTDIIHLDALFDPSAMTAYVGVPELNASYLSLDLTEMMNEYSGVSVNSYRLSQMLSRSRIDPGRLKETVTRYFALVLDGIDRVAVNSGTVTAGGISNSCSTATVTFEGEDILRIARTCLNAAADDSQAEDLVYQFMSMSGKYHCSAGYFHSTYAEWIQDALDELDEVSPEDISESIQLTAYMSPSGKVLGRSLKVLDDGELKALLSFLTARDGDRLGVEASFGAYDSYSSSDRYWETRNEVTLSGVGDYTAEGRLSGSFLVGYNQYEDWNGSLDEIDLPLVTADVDGVLGRGSFIGDVVLTPCRQLLDLAEEEMSGAPEAVIDFVRGLSLIISNRSSDTRLDGIAALRSSGRTFLTLDLSASEIDGMDITLPSDPVDQDAWASSIGIASLAEIIIRLRSAGVPAELLNGLLR